MIETVEVFFGHEQLVPVRAIKSARRLVLELEENDALVVFRGLMNGAMEPPLCIKHANGACDWYITTNLSEKDRELTHIEAVLAEMPERLN